MTGGKRGTIRAAAGAGKTFERNEFLSSLPLTAPYPRCFGFGLLQFDQIYKGLSLPSRVPHFQEILLILAQQKKQQEAFVISPLPWPPLPQPSRKEEKEIKKFLYRRKTRILVCTMGRTMRGTTYCTRRITTVKPCLTRSSGNCSVQTWKREAHRIRPKLQRRSTQKDY